MLEIVNTPARTIQDTGYISRWLATDSPIIFEVQRKDNIISSTQNSAGYLLLNLATTNPIFSLVVDEPIALYDSFNKVFIRTTIKEKLSESTYITNLEYTPLTFTYYVAYAKRVGYFFEAKLTVNGIAQSTLIRFTPDVNGTAKCDISGYLQTYVNDTKVNETNVANIAEKNQSGKFKIAFKENYIGNTNFDFTSDVNDYYYLKAARSIEKGANVQEYVPNLEKESKFLNYFTEPTYWLGLPFDISFIYSELMQGKQLQVIEEHYNSLNVLLSTQTIDIDSANIGKLNSLLLNVQSIEQSCEYIKLQLITDDATPPVEPNVWYITVSPWSPSQPLKFEKNAGTVTVTGKRAMVGTRVIDLPNVALIPASKKTITSNYTTPVTSFGTSFLISKLNFIYDSSIFNGSAAQKRMIFWLGCSAYTGTAVKLDMNFSSTATNYAQYMVEFKALLQQAVTSINNDLSIHGQILSLTEVVSGGGVTTLSINTLKGGSLGYYIGTNSGTGIPITADYLGVLGNINATFIMNVPLFDIDTDGKVKNGWQEYYNIDSVVLPDINTTYTL